MAPGIEDLLTRSSGELLAGYAEQVREAAEAGDMGKVRDANFAELVRLGAFASTREFLSRVSDPKNGLPRDMQLRAKAFLGLEKRGVKLDAIEIQAANFLKTGTPDRASWAGLLGRSADYKSFGVYINLDQAHDRGTAAQTILHELSHAATLAKINGQAKLTADEKQAIADLNAMRRRAILRAGDASPTIKAEAEAKGITDPRDRTAFYETRLRELSSTDPEFRDYNGLANLDEFVVEMTGSPEFLDLLRRLGFGGADTTRKTLGGMIRDAFQAILKLIAPGISASSEIGKAFTDSWNLTYAGSKPVVSPGELLQATRGITEVKEAAPVPKKGTKKKSTTVDAAAPQGEAAETQTETSTAKTPASVSPKAPQGGKGSVTSDNDKATTQTPESNNQPSAQPESSNPEVPKARGAGEGSGAAVEATKRRRGRPTKREMRDETKLPVSREEFEAEMAQGEMTPEEREAEFKEAPQSPAAKPRVVKAALTDDERDLAELRASNMEDILFYNGITEEQYYTLVGEGILTPKEIEAGYMQNVPQMLSNISGDESQPGPLRHVAQMLLDLGFDFSKVRFRAAETADAQAEGGWAGLYRAGTSARSGEISINMDSAHRGGVAQSIVHEALHHVFFWKTQKGYPLNRVERAAFNDLQKIFKQAERAALGRYARGGETIGQRRARLAPGDLFYGLTNVDEFITEILTNPEFQVFLQQIQPMQSLPKKGGYIRNLLDQIFSYLRDFVYGRDVSGDSLLTQGLDNVLALIQTPQTESGVQRAVNQMLGEPMARATMPADESVNPEAPMSPAGDAMKFLAKVTGTEGVRTFTGGEYKPAGLLSPDGKLPEQIGDAWRKSRQEIAAVARRVETSAYRLNKAIKAERKAGREVSTDLMNTALGSLDNPLTKGQRAEINALRAEASEAKGKQREALEQEANELEGSYMAKNREDFRDKQAKALAQLPANVAEAISEMAEHRTELQTILKKSGAVDSKIAATIDATLGIYLHRSYEIFDNPKYAEEVRKNEKVMQAAQNLIRRQIESRNADKLIALAAEEGGILPRAEALKQAPGTAKQEEVDRVIEKLLAVGEESLGGVILKGRIPGQMDLWILDSRGNISPEIQALWGRYDDLLFNCCLNFLGYLQKLRRKFFFRSLGRDVGLRLAGSSSLFQ